MPSLSLRRLELKPHRRVSGRIVDSEGFSNSSRLHEDAQSGRWHRAELELAMLVGARRQTQFWSRDHRVGQRSETLEFHGAMQRSEWSRANGVLHHAWSERLVPLEDGGSSQTERWLRGDPKRRPYGGRNPRKHDLIRGMLHRRKREKAERAMRSARGLEGRRDEVVEHDLQRWAPQGARGQMFAEFHQIDGDTRGLAGWPQVSTKIGSYRGYERYDFAADLVEHRVNKGTRSVGASQLRSRGRSRPSLPRQHFRGRVTSTCGVHPDTRRRAKIHARESPAIVVAQSSQALFAMRSS